MSTNQVLSHRGGETKAPHLVTSTNLPVYARIALEPLVVNPG